MKINIVYNISDAPTGGGNQFLRALAESFRRSGHYTETPEQAQCILFNSHHCIAEVLELKKRFPEKVFVHRVDGPMRLYNSPSDNRDFITNAAGALLEAVIG